jgi:hypothetical protein
MGDWLAINGKGYNIVLFSSSEKRVIEPSVSTSYMHNGLLVSYQ